MDLILKLYICRDVNTQSIRPNVEVTSMSILTSRITTIRNIASGVYREHIWARDRVIRFMQRQITQNDHVCEAELCHPIY